MAAGAPSPDKASVLAQLVAAVARERATLEAAARSTLEAATHEESKPENDKDTRALEASYLAGAQAARARELDAALAALAGLRPRAFGAHDPVALGAIVRVGETTAQGTTAARTYFIAPEGGGFELHVGGLALAVVTPASPLGRALIGKAAGDLVELRSPKGLREIEIESVS